MTIYIIEKREEGSQHWEFVTKSTNLIETLAIINSLRRIYSDENCRYREVQ